MPVIGYFSGRSPEAEEPMRAPFLKALETTGSRPGATLQSSTASRKVGRNVCRCSRPNSFADRWQCWSSRPRSALAAKAATETIPIVFPSGLDPVQLGLVASLDRPGATPPGEPFTTELGPKRLGLVRELLPQPGTIAFVVNPNNTMTPFQVMEMQAAAQAVGQPLLVFNAGTEEQVDKAFAAMAERNVAAILYVADVFSRWSVSGLSRSRRVTAFPRSMNGANSSTAGGLMSYSTDRTEAGGKREHMPGAFSRARSRPTCRLCSHRVRARHQSKDSKGAWPRDTAGHAYPRRRDDRMSAPAASW